MKVRRTEWSAQGLCFGCGEVEVEVRPGKKMAKCAGCLAIDRMKRQARRERLPTIRKFEIALEHARRGEEPRVCLHYAGLLDPLLRDAYGRKP